MLSLEAVEGLLECPLAMSQPDSVSIVQAVLKCYMLAIMPAVGWSYVLC